MSLSREERRAWAELERSLAGEFPSAPDPSRQEPGDPAAELASWRLLTLVLIVGAAVLVTGALTLVPFIWITWIMVLCIGAGRIQRRNRGLRPFGRGNSDRA